eukprot:2003312-Rhodomonas_salina.5
MGSVLVVLRMCYADSGTDTVSGTTRTAGGPPEARYGPRIGCYDVLYPVLDWQIQHLIGIGYYESATTCAVLR